jgi:ubiquinone biosynthesis UbiH/UbiF/VisC/COQ6 family hydroxylase
MVVQGDRGGELVFDARQVGTHALNWIVDVPALEHRLAEALRYQGQVERFQTGEPLPTARLTVVCEGRRSLTRAEWGFEYQTQPYPHHALAARLDLGAPHGGVARQWFSGHDIVAWLPLGGDHGTQVALVWSTAADRIQRLLALDADDFLAELRPLCKPWPAAMTLTHSPQSWPLEIGQASTWVAPGVALAGDAAHAMHPLAGQGLNVGLGDAAELARVLREREYWRDIGDVRLLRRYERARKAAFAAMGGLTDGLFILFNTPATGVQNLRNWGLSGVDHLPPLKRWLARQAMGV